MVTHAENLTKTALKFRTSNPVVYSDFGELLINIGFKGGAQSGCKTYKSFYSIFP